MMTAMLTVRNIEAGERVYDIWAVNEDAEYHEAGYDGAHKVSAPGIGALTPGECAALSSERAVPMRAPRRAA